MKGKFSSIGRVVFVLMLVLSLSLVAAVPAAALTQPTVTIDTGESEISYSDAGYTIIFTLGEELIETTDTITITFPVGTTVAASVTATILASPGWFSAAADTTEGWENSLVAPGDVTFSGNATARTVTATLPHASDTEIGAAATVQIKITAGITNPSAVGDYNLTVKTSQETTAVTSDTYSITAPVLGGTVEVFNPSGVLMVTYSGANALDTAMSANVFDATHADYTIEVGPGTYTLSSVIEIRGEGLTFKGANYGVNPVTETRGAESIIDVTGANAITIYADDVSVDGFTVDFSTGNTTGIEIQPTSAGDTKGVTVKNNIIRDATAQGIHLAAKNAQLYVVAETTISNNVIEDSHWAGIMLDLGAKDNTISNNTVTGTTAGGDGAITFDGNSGNTITGNTITDNTGSGIGFWGPNVSDDNLVEGNTISRNTTNGILVKGTAPTKLVITGNDITDNEGVGILIESWTAASDAIKFNNITGNDADNDGYGLTNDNSGTVDAALNWWGTAVASEVAAMVNDINGGVTDYAPFLSDTVDAVFSATALDTDADSLDAEDEVGVKVSTTGFTSYVISAAKYIDNPGAPLDNVLGFYDVYVTGNNSSTDVVVVKFYADGVDEDSVVYAWNELYDTWQECDPQDFSFWGGYAYVTIHREANTDDPTTPTIEALSGLPFAIVGEAAASDFDVYELYDADGDGVISKTEALAAIADYFNGDITKAQALLVILEYFG